METLLCALSDIIINPAFAPLSMFVNQESLFERNRKPEFTSLAVLTNQKSLFERNHKPRIHP